MQNQSEYISRSRKLFTSVRNSWLGLFEMPIWQFWIATALFTLVAVVSVSHYEVIHYYDRSLELYQFDLTSWDYTLVYWSLFSRSLVLLIPIVSAGMFFAFLGFKKTSRAVICWGSALLFGWLVVDVNLQRYTGFHLHDYLHYLITPATWEWGGDMSQVIYKLLKKGLEATLSIVVAFILIQMLVQKYTHQLRRLKWPLTTCLNVILIAVIVGIFPLRNGVNEPIALVRLYSAMPSAFAPFAPENIKRSSEIAFSVDCNHEFDGLAEQFCVTINNPTALDSDFSLKKQNLPNVVLFIVESFRHDALSKERMPKLSRWSENGMVLREHFANGNTSHHGSFALVYGRSPVTFESTLSANIPPQMCYSLRNSGYESSLIASCHFEFLKMDTFFNDSNFDHVKLNQTGDWSERDRTTLAEVKQIITKPSEKPQFVVVYLMSTHAPYIFPEPQDPAESVPPANSDSPEDLRERYHRSLKYVDGEFDKLFRSVPSDKNLFVITGDHGESFGDDGLLYHGTKLSEIQTRVPMIIHGPNVPSRVVTTKTAHVDLLPTMMHILNDGPVTIANIHGRDRLEKNSPDQVLLARQLFHTSAFELMLVRGKDKLLMSLDGNERKIRLMGFCDSSAGYQRELGHNVTEIPDWISYISEECHQMQYQRYDRKPLPRISSKTKTNIKY